MKAKITLLLFLLLASVSISAQVISLNNKWTFALDPLKVGERNGWYQPSFPVKHYDQVSIPHCFSVDPRYLLYTGTAWYFKTVDAPALPAGSRAFLKFDAVFYKAAIWWNGQRIGDHEGGYTPFELDVTHALQNKNTLAVAVDNSWDTTTIPGAKTTDSMLTQNAAQVYAWMNYGGIMRPVYLVIRPDVIIRQMKVEAVPDLKKKTAQIRIRAVVKNYSDKTISPAVTVNLFQAGKKINARFTSTPNPILPNKEDTILLSASLPASATTLWYPDAPALYTTELITGTDTVRTTFGIRKVEVRGTALLLNGEAIRMGGANRPADFPGLGALDPDSVVEKDLSLMKSAGMELCRIAHYAVAENILHWADQHGMLIITEAGNWQMTTRQMADTEMRKKFRQQMQEMMERDWNHPSVIAYSLGNEFQSQTPEGIAWVKDMSQFVKTLDTTRLITFASYNVWRDYVKKPEDEASNYVDFISANIYGNHLKCLQHIHEVYPGKPVYISEFGMRASNKKEALRIDYLRKALEAIRKVDYVVGASWWSFNDYQSRFPGTDPDGYRAWGLVTPQRTLRSTYTVWQEEFSPATVEIIRREQDKIICKVTARNDFPSYTLRNYQLRCGDQAVAIPALQPGASQLVTLPTPPGSGAPLTISLIKPGGFVVLTKTL